MACTGLPTPFGVPSPTSPKIPSPHPGEGGFLCLLPYLLPARLPTSFPNLFGNKASVHSQGLAGQGGVGPGGPPSGGGWGEGTPSSIMSLGSPNRPGLAQLNLERLRDSRGRAQREKSRLVGVWDVGVRTLRGGHRGRGTEGKTWRVSNRGLEVWDDVWMILCESCAKHYAKQHLLGKRCWGTL